MHPKWVLLSSFVSSLTIKKVTLGKDNHQATVQLAAYELLIPGQMKSLWTALHLGIRNMDFIWCSFDKVLLPSPPPPPSPLPLQHIFAIFRFQDTLSRCCVKLQYIIVLWKLLLLSMANTKLHRILNGSWVTISSPKNSPIVQFDTTPTQSPGQPLKRPKGEQSPYLLWNLSGASSLWRWKSKQSSAPIPMPK